MARRATVTEADMRRAIKAAGDCGLTMRECIMRPTEIRLVFAGDVDAEPLSGQTSHPKPWPIRRERGAE